MASSLERVVSLCKRRGFVFLDSEIYGGLANAWALGPLGVQLRRKLRDRWWRDFIQSRRDCFGIETPVIMNPKVWKTAGHVDSFSDELVECRHCHMRHRADKMDELPCQTRDRCEWTEPRKFNMLFSTTVGPVDSTSADAAKSMAYLRPETAQGIFTNFQHITTAMRITRPPFGIGQIGKAFRNEISPGQFLFRLREFEQLELEWFCEPAESPRWFEYWRDYCFRWLVDKIGLRQENLRLVHHGPGDCAHYAAAATDIEYKFPFGWGELWGIANRTDFDLRQHAAASGKKLQLEGGIIPHCVEPSVGVDRLMLAVLCDALHEEQLVAEETGGESASRTLLKLHPSIAPFRAAVFPLMKKPELVDMARQVLAQLEDAGLDADYDESGSIGRRYRRHDEIGTPFCITVDYESLASPPSATVRFRDSLQQRRVAVSDLHRIVAV